jgi:L-malate glycosyltransferase
MKICFLASSNSIHSLKWIKYFSDLKYEVLWISLEKSSVDIPKNIEYFELRNNLIFSIFNTRKIILKSKPDILHVHYLGNHALVALFSKMKCIISTPWGSDIIYGKKSFIKRQIISKLLKKSRVITCDAYHMRDEILNFGISNEKIHIINFGIDSNRFLKRDKDLNLLKELNIQAENIVLSMRNFEKVYDIETLLYAAEIILKEIPNTCFLLLGRGELKEYLEGIAKKLKIINSIRFLGHLDNEALPSLLSSVDVYVSTSLSDAGIAASTAEAMACEVPVVISDSGENNRWIKNGDNGFLVPVSEPKELATQVIKILKNKSSTKKIGKNGRQIIVDKNDISNEMSKMNHLYDKISDIG